MYASTVVDLLYLQWYKGYEGAKNHSWDNEKTFVVLPQLAKSDFLTSKEEIAPKNSCVNVFKCAMIKGEIVKFYND